MFRIILIIFITSFKSLSIQILKNISIFVWYLQTDTRCMRFYILYAKSSGGNQLSLGLSKTVGHMHSQRLRSLCNTLDQCSLIRTLTSHNLAKI